MQYIYEFVKEHPECDVTFSRDIGKGALVIRLYRRTFSNLGISRYLSDDVYEVLGESIIQDLLNSMLIELKATKWRNNNEVR